MTDRKVIARGAVMVDPRAAVARLREFQLRDARYYALELVRAAVAGGATRLAVRNTSREFVLDAEGDAPAARDLSRVLDFLLSNADRRLRLMAIAINTAIGMRPDYIDVYTTAHEGDAAQVARVRWAPSRARGRDAAAMFEPTSVDVVARPKGMPPRGFRVHMRESFGWSVMREWASMPAETALLLTRCGALDVPLTLEGRAMTAARVTPEALCSVELSEGVGHEAIKVEFSLLAVDGRAGINTLLMCELGVELSRERLCDPVLGVSAALWMRVSASVLPTNNARDRVNLDGAFGRSLARLRSAGLQALVLRAGELIAQRGPAEEAVREALASLALVALSEGDEPARQVFGADVRAALQRAPLLVDARGALVTLNATRRREGPMGVLRRDTKVPDEIARWIEPVVWVRARDPVASALVVMLDLPDRRAALETATAVYGRYAKFQSQPEQEPAVEARSGREVLRAAFAVEGARGVVVARSNGKAVLSVRPYFDRRPFDPEVLEETELEVEIAIESEKLSPRPSFDGVCRDDAFDEAVTRARMAFVEAAAQLASRETADPEGLAGVTRQAMAWALWPRASATVTRQRAATAADRWPELLRVKAWPTTDGDVRVSAAAVIHDGATGVRAALVAPRGAQGRRADGRAVLSLTAPWRAVLEAYVDATARWVNYAPWLEKRAVADLRGLVRDELMKRSAGWMRFRHGGLRGTCAAVMGRGEVLVAHHGVLTETRSTSGALGSVLVVIDDDGLIPAGTGRAALEESYSEECKRCMTEVAGDLVATLARALLGDREARRQVELDPGEIHPAVARLLLGALASVHNALGVTFGLREPMTGAALAELLESVALVPVCTGPARVTLASVRTLRHRTAPIPVLRAAPDDVDFEAFEPLIVVDREFERLIAAAVNLPLEDATATLPSRRQARARRLSRDKLSRRPVVSLDAVTGRFRHTITSGRDARGVIAIPENEPPQVEVLLEGRVMVTLSWQELEFGVVGRVELSQDLRFTANFEGLTALGRAVLDEVLHDAVEMLVAEVATTAMRGDDPGDNARRVLAGWVISGAKKRSMKNTLRELYGGLKVWRDGRGRSLSAMEAVSAGRVLLARAPEGAWEPPVEGDGQEPAVVLVPAGEDLSLWAKCLQVLSGAQPRDVTDVVERTQRARRLRHRRGAEVGLSSRAPARALSTRIERRDAALGVGELRLVPGDAAMTVEVFVDGRRVRDLTLASPIGLACALESPWIEPNDIAGSVERANLGAKLLLIARWLMDAMFVADDDEVGELPAWAGPALRWHVLTAPEHLPREAREAPLFQDSEARPMSLDAVQAEAAAHGAVAFTVDPPAGPIAPLGSDRRVLVLAPAEVRWLRAKVAALDYTDTLREDAEARAYDQRPPAAKIEAHSVTVPRGAVRCALTGELEGEAVFWPPGSERESVVQWFRARRPLGSSPLGAPWPVMAAVECGSLVPNRRRTAPEAGVALDDAIGRAQRAVLLALEGQFPLPQEALSGVLLREARELGFSRPTPTAVGRLWITPSIEPGGVRVRDGRGAHWVPTECPVSGELWWRKPVEAGEAPWKPSVESAARWAWTRLLEGLTDRAHELSPAGDAARLHIAHAGTSGVMHNGRLGTWSRRTRLVGSETTWAAVFDANESPTRILKVSPGDPRARSPRVLEDRPDAWFALLVARGVFTTDEDQAAERAKKATEDSAREAQRALDEKARQTETARPTAREPPRVEWPAARSAAELLRGCGIEAAQLREIVGVEREGPPEVDRAKAVVIVPRGGVVMAGVESLSPARSTLLLAVIALGALGREHGAEAIDEPAVMRKLLQKLG